MYNKTNWIAGQTEVSAENLNKIEEEIYKNSLALDDATEPVEGEYITVRDCVAGAITDIEILGKTVQGTDLSDIQSVGTATGDGRFKMSILSCGKNLFDVELFEMGSLGSDGNLEPNDGRARTKSFIPLKGSTKFTLSKESAQWVSLYEYDKDYKFIKQGFNSTNTVNSFTTAPNTRFVKIKTDDSLHIAKANKFQLEEGTQATPYEPYQANKSSILMPVQLGNGDRLYYDDVEKAWCIDKVEVDLVLNGSEQWHIDSNGVLYVPATSWAGKPHKPSLPCISTRYAQAENNSDVHDKIYMGNNYLFMIKPSGFSDIVSWKNELKANPLPVKYQASTPNKIILPQDQQIALNSFFGTTHIFTEDTIIEPTFKAKVSKSIGATVSSLGVKTDILEDRLGLVEGLQDSANFKYYTEKGHVVAENTNNGQIDALKLEGRTLVNKSVFGKSVNLPRLGLTCYEKGTIEPNCKYTISYEIKSVDVGITGLRLDGIRQNLPQAVGKHLVLVDSSDVMPSNTKLYWSGELNTFGVIENFTLIEGDHTQNPPSYFEGLKSVGEDVERIEVLSHKGTIDMEQGTIDSTNGLIGSSSTRIRSDFLKCSNNRTDILNIDFSKFQVIFFGYDKDKKYIKVGGGGIWSSSNITFDVDVYYYRFIVKNIENSTITTENMFIIQETLSHKKRILYYNEANELVPVPCLREWDKVENGKYTVGSEQMVIDGSVVTANGIVGQYSEYLVSNSISNINEQSYREFICDKFNFKPPGEYTGIYFSKGKIRLRVLTTLFPTEESLRGDLQANPVTVVYQLATPKTYETINLDLNSYVNETLVLVDAGVINPKMSFEITSHIGNTVNVLRDRISYLEDKVFNYAVVQNRLMLTSRYNADTSMFKIDYNSGVINEVTEVVDVDQDLFELLKDNILVGKDNYDYNKMIEMIDFYVLNGIISWEMWDILALAMELQHNPPVEEVPEI